MLDTVHNKILRLGKCFGHRGDWNGPDSLRGCLTLSWLWKSLIKLHLWYKIEFLKDGSHLVVRGMAKALLDSSKHIWIFGQELGMTHKFLTQLCMTLGLRTTDSVEKPLPTKLDTEPNQAWHCCLRIFLKRQVYFYLKWNPGTLLSWLLHMLLLIFEHSILWTHCQIISFFFRELNYMVKYHRISLTAGKHKCGYRGPSKRSLDSQELSIPLLSRNPPSSSLI